MAFCRSIRGFTEDTSDSADLQAETPARCTLSISPVHDSQIRLEVALTRPGASDDMRDTRLSGAFLITPDRLERTAEQFGLLAERLTR